MKSKSQALTFSVSHIFCKTKPYSAGTSIKRTVARVPRVSAYCGFHCNNIRTFFSHREGACLGLGLAVSSLCKESLVDSRVHVTNLYHKLMDKLNEQDDRDPDQKLQVGSLMSHRY